MFFYETLQRCDGIEFYYQVEQAVDQEFNKKFTTLSKIVLHVLSLPTSNADAERIFSSVNLIKTKVRNSLHLPSLKALIFVAEYTRNHGGIGKVMSLPSMHSCVT